MSQTNASTPAASAHRCLPGRAARVLWLVWLSLCLAGCVVIPYQPEPETQHELAEVPRPELIRLSAGPRQFLAEMSEEIRKGDPRLEPVDGQAFIDAAAPDGELTLADLLDPTIRPRIESLAVDLLVLLDEPEEQETVSIDMMSGSYFGFLGFEKSTRSSSYRATLIDLERLQVVDQVRSTATGTDAGVGLFYGLFIVSDAAGGAQRGLVRDLIAGMTGVRPEGSVRLVLLASEAIRTSEDIVLPH